MRHFLLFVISATLFGQFTPSKQKCSVSDEETLRHLQEIDIVDLQTNLYTLPGFEADQVIDALHLQVIASEAVFSLANTFSAGSDRFHQCLLSDVEYYRKTSEANKMFVHIGGAVSYEAWERAMGPNRWPLKNIPPMIGHGAPNPAIRGHKLPMHPAIELSLEAYARKGQEVDMTDPIQVAALELLGQKQNYDVKNFKLIRFFRLNPKNLLNEPRFLYSNQLGVFRSKPASERLAILADVYLSQ